MLQSGNNRKRDRERSNRYGGYSGQGVKLITQLDVVSRLRKIWSYTSVPHTSSWGDV
jgi:hypothetical protein